jgi:hypothetical protein
LTGVRRRWCVPLSRAEAHTVSKAASLLKAAFFAGQGKRHAKNIFLSIKIRRFLL